MSGFFLSREDDDEEDEFEDLDDDRDGLRPLSFCNELGFDGLDGNGTLDSCMLSSFSAY